MTAISVILLANAADNVQLLGDGPRGAGVSYNPIKDSYVRAGSPTLNYGTISPINVYASTSDARRIYVEFNTSAIPAGATITSANLSLYLSSAPSSTRNHGVHRVTSASWTETGITWNNQPTVSAATSTIATGTTSNVWKTWDVTVDVRGFVNGSYSNYGWSVRDVSELDSALTSYYSREYGTAGLRPQLNISYSVILDNAPTTSLSSPADGNKTSLASVDFSCSATDDFNLSNITLYWNYTGSWLANGTNASVLNNTATTFSRTGLTDKSIIWNCRACDNASQCSFASANRTVIVDMTAPAIALPVYTNATKYRNTQNMIFNVSVIDVGAGPGYCSVNVNGSTNTTVAVSSGWCNGTYALTGLGDGNLTIYAYANDTLGNTGLNKSYVVWIDTTKPTITVSSPLNRTYNTTGILINFSAADDSSISSKWYYNGSANVTYSSPVSLNFSETSYTLIFYANDTVGNVNYSSLTFSINATPLLNLINAYPSLIAGGGVMTVNSSVYDGTNDTLQFFCSENSTSPNSTNTICTGGNTLMDVPYNLTCTYTVAVDNANHTVYCRVFDSAGYNSSVKNSTYTTQSEVPVTSVVSVAGDTVPSYFDTANDGVTLMAVSGDRNITCKWSSSDLAYSAMTNPCTSSGIYANCSINDISAQGFYTRYISCADSLGSGQNSSNNLDVQFYLDYTAPTTSDNSDSNVHAPNYTVTITESDVVDSDPVSHYCTSSSAGCDPVIDIDNGGTIIYTASNRGINYLRYYSMDDAANNQTIVNKTININWLPVLTSAIDNATTIKGGAIVGIFTNSSDADAHTLTLFVCNSSGANFSGCTGVQYCTATGTANLSCAFASESDSAAHTWYSYIFDALGEAASANPVTGSYATDSQAPEIAIVSPANATYSETSVTAEITTSEAADAAIYSLDEDANITMSNISSTAWTAEISGLSEGIHNITFYANDSYGNTGNSSIRYFTVSLPPDTNAPAITIIAPLNASYISITPLLNITTDEALGWAGYSLNGGALTSLTSATTTNWYAVLALSEESTNTLIVYANDTSNNQANKTITFYGDSLAPRYSGAQASPSPTNVSVAVNCSVSWADSFNITSVKISENSLGVYENHTIDFSGISGTASYIIIGAKLAASGNYECIFYAADIAGNMNSTSVSFNVNDITAPTIIATSPSNGVTYNQLYVPLSMMSSEPLISAEYSLDGAANVTMIDASPTSWYETLSGLITGNTYSVMFYGEDPSGNIGASSSITFTIDTGLTDTIPPVITIDSISNGTYYTETSLDLDITTNENTTWAGYSLNGGAVQDMTNSSMTEWSDSLSGLGSESTNILVVYANDTSSNTGNKTITFYVDEVPPVFSDVSASPNPANESQNVICVADISEAFSLASVKISENSSGAFENHTIELYSSGSANHTINNLAKGYYRCIFYASDAAGNFDSASASFNVNDVTAPSVTINSPLNQTYSTNSVLFSITASESVASAVYSINGGENVSMSGSGISWSKTSAVSDGNYCALFYAVDSSGNTGTSQVCFSSDTSVYDTSSPIIAIWSPVNGSYSLVEDVLFNITSNENLAWAGYSVDSGSIINLGNTSSINWNKTQTIAEGAHSVIFYANDTSVNKNRGNRTSVFYVDLNNPSVNSFSCISPINDSANVSCSASLSDAVGLDNIVISYNATGNWLNYSLDLSGTSENISHTILAGNTTPPGFRAMVYLYDLSGRLNDSSFFDVVVADDTAPSISNITYVPNTTAELDPGIIVNVSADVSEDYLISSVVLMYKNSSSSVWSSASMSNNAGINYNASMTLGNGTWTFKINATDAAGNSYVSENHTLVVENDIYANISTTIPAVKSFTYAQRAANNSLGELILNNTGDGSLTFNVTLISSSLETRLNINYTGEQTMNYTLASGESISLAMIANTTGLNVLLYTYNIYVVSAAGAETFEKQLNIQTSSGPYLVVSIDEYSSRVTKGQEGVVLQASVSNLGTQDATFVYLNWSLPNEFTITSGNASRDVGNLPISTSSTNTITISVSGSADDKDVNITSSASSAENISDSDTKQITIGSPITITEETGGGGGGGGGAAGLGIEKIVYSKIIEIVRGEEDSFEIEIKNNYVSSTLEGLTLDLTGFPSQYVAVSPNRIDRINPGETGRFKITLKVPYYKESYEEHILKAVITGNRIIDGAAKQQYIETQNILLIIQEISREKSNASLMDAEKAILEMKDAGFNADGAEKLLEQAKSRLNERKNKEAKDLAEDVVNIKNKAFLADNIIRRVIEALKNPKRNYLLVGSGMKNFESEDNGVPLSQLMNEKTIFSSKSIENTLGLAVAAFERGDYDIAEERARSAQLTLLLERKGSFGMFLYMYWYFILAGLLVFSFAGILSYKAYLKSSITRRIRNIDKEEDSLRNIMSFSQKNYFSGKISAGEYHSTMSQHQNKLAKIKQERVRLRNKRIKMLKPLQVLRDLGAERMQVENGIKKLQEQFYKGRKISEAEYNTDFKILNERLAEIEDEKTTAELLRKGK